MPRLEFYQSLWAMELRSPDGIARDVGQAFEMVAEAGFDGMGMDLGEADIPGAYAAAPLFRKHGLKCQFTAFPKSTASFRQMLAMAVEFECPFLNVVGRVMPITLDGMVAVVRHWIDLADEAGMPLLFETHRNGITNDLFTTLNLLDAVPEMRLCADLSNYLLDREFSYPLSDTDHRLIDRVLHRSDAFQGRIASNQQIQIPLAFPQHRKWLELFIGWWERGFDHWRRRAADDDSLTFMCELGPAPYAITDAGGYELSDRWEETLQLRDHARQAWSKAERSMAIVE